MVPLLFIWERWRGGLGAPGGLSRCSCLADSCDMCRYPGRPDCSILAAAPEEKITNIYVHTLELIISFNGLVIHRYKYIHKYIHVCTCAHILHKSCMVTELKPRVRRCSLEGGCIPVLTVSPQANMVGLLKPTRISPSINPIAMSS